MKVREVVPNNRKKVFEVTVSDGRTLDYPYAKLRLRPDRSRRIAAVFVDSELGNEAFTYRLSSGEEDSIHIEQVLEYNSDPNYLRELALYELTLEARERVEQSALSKRQIIRRLGTSAAQFYRLLDQTNYTKSIGQLLALLEVLDCEVEFVVRDKPSSHGSSLNELADGLQKVSG
ncbi:MAG: hypothetical protein ACE5HV_14980 [Acidobacteriota bacterium]